MKAWRVYGVDDMRLDDIPVPEVKPGWVLVKVKIVQLSITEIQQLKGIGVGGVNVDKMIKEQGPLQLFGHEFCGEVVEIGKGVETLKKGDRVFWARALPCHNCELCRAGQEKYCTTFLPLGMGVPGCLAEYCALPADSGIVSVPDEVTDSEAATMQPLVSCVGNVVATEIEAGDTVAVLGQGLMGLNTMQAARVCGAGKVIAVDIRDEALEVAKKVGADITINANQIDPVEAVMEITKGLGAKVVFECAGGTPEQGLSGLKTLHQALDMVAHYGKIMQVAFLPPDAAVSIKAINDKGLIFMGRRHSFAKEVNYTVDLVASKRIQLAPYMTHTLEGLDKVPEAFEISGNKAKYHGVNPAQVIVTQ